MAYPQWDLVLEAKRVFSLESDGLKGFHNFMKLKGFEQKRLP
jgi:hypothetical protein